MGMMPQEEKTYYVHNKEAVAHTQVPGPIQQCVEKQENGIQCHYGEGPGWERGQRGRTENGDEIIQQGHMRIVYRVF